jgi:hypothetical protein
VVAQGPIDDLLGESAVRIRATGIDHAESRLAAFGPVARDGDWLTIRPIDPSRVPDVVEAIVHEGGRVHAVDPARSTLEDRYLALFADRGGSPGEQPPARDRSL